MTMLFPLAQAEDLASARISNAHRVARNRQTLGVRHGAG